MRRLRWLAAAAVVGCSQPASLDERMWGDPVLAKLREAQAEEYAKLTLRRELDSLGARAAEPDSPVAALRVVVHGGVESGIAALTERAARNVWTRVVGDAPKTPTVVAIYRADTAVAGKYTRAVRSFAGALLPDGASRKACTVVIPRELALGDTLAQSSWIMERIESLLAPCVFYARFGRPGHGVEAWLAATGSRAIQTLDWRLHPHRTPGAEGAWIFEGPHFGDTYYTLSWSLTGAVPPPYWSGLLQVGCLGGRVADCEGALTGTTGRASEPALPAGIVSGQGLWYWSTGSAIPSEHFFSDLIRDLGEERFAALWTSERALPDAFQAVYGEPFGTYVAQWGRHAWDRQTDAAPIRLGVALDPWLLLMTLGWSALFAAFAAVLTRRREPGAG